MSGEKQWYNFSYYNQVFEADGQALLEELEAEVARPQADGRDRVGRKLTDHGAEAH